MTPAAPANPAPPKELFEAIGEKLAAAAHVPGVSSDELNRLSAELNFLQVFDWPPDGAERLSRVELVVDAIVATEPDESCKWPDPTQLGQVEVVPSFAPELIPEPFRTYVIDEAERMSVQPEVIAMPLVATLGSVVGRSIGIYPKAHDSWLLPPNLWSMIIAPPSSLKSPALDAGTRFMEQLAEDASAEYQKDRNLREARVQILEGQKAKLLKDANSKPTTALAEEIAKLSSQLTELQAPAKRYMTNDPTVEMLMELLRDNPKGICLVRDELSGWLATCEKRGREGDREVFIEGYNSKPNYTIDRIGRGTIRVPALSLSIVGGIQPGKLEAYVLGAIEGGREADGLLQRFQLAIYPDPLTDYEHVDRKPDLAARQRVQQVFRLLDSFDAEAHPELEQADGGIPGIRFSPAAQEEFDAWYTNHMRRLRSNKLRTTPAFEAHLGKAQATVAKLALLFHLIDTAGDEHIPPVSLEAVRQAIGWIYYLEQNARKIYSAELAKLDLSVRELAERVINGDVHDGMTKRDLTRKGWRGLKSAASVTKALDHLATRGWLRLEEVKGTPGRPSTTLRINPLLESGDYMLD